MTIIQSDSRKVKKGDIFIALRGISSDGHSYIEKAIENGASKIIAEEGEYSIPTEIVPDTRKYLNEYLEQNYNKILNKLNIIGITGTNGKTTTAWFIHSILNQLGKSSAYIGTIGYYINGQKVSDLPNTTVDICDLYNLMLDANEKDCKTIILEISSHALLTGRVTTVKFDGTIFTNLTQDHLDYHKTMGNYALAKQQLFKQLKEDGIGVVNNDDKYKEYFLLPEFNTVTYGFDNSDYKIESYNMTNGGTTFTYQYQDESYLVHINLVGRYNIYNILSAIALLNQLGLDLNDINGAIQNISAPVGRLEFIDYKNNSIVIDYAHTPDGLEKIISTMKEIIEGKVYVIFGCTGERDRMKRPIMAGLVSNMADYFIITNDDPHFEDPNQIVNDMVADLEKDNYEVCLDRKAAIHKGIDLLHERDALLILGKGHEEIMIIKDQKVPFNDKKTVLEYIDK